VLLKFFSTLKSLDIIQTLGMLPLTTPTDPKGWMIILKEDAYPLKAYK
jgi:hypothetical protein